MSKSYDTQVGAVYDFFIMFEHHDVLRHWHPMTVHRMVESKMKKQCEEKVLG